MRFCAPALLLSTLALGSCFVDVPEEDEGEFACEADGDCADGYHCAAPADGVGRCVPEAGGADCANDADCAGMGTGYACVRASATVHVCVHRCSVENDCGPNEACVMTWSFSGGNTKACKQCCANGPPNCGTCASPATCNPAQAVARNYDEAGAICQ